jgi:hypothetical protein
MSMINTPCLMALCFLDTLLIVKLSCILNTPCLMALYFPNSIDCETILHILQDINYAHDFLLGLTHFKQFFSSDLKVWASENLLNL